MAYTVLFQPAARRELGAQQRRDQQRVLNSIEALADNPRPAGVEKLSGTSEKYRIRQGNFRILYEIQDDVLVVYVVRIADRKDVYRRGGG